MRFSAVTSKRMMLSWKDPTMVVFPSLRSMLIRMLDP